MYLLHPYEFDKLLELKGSKRKYCSDNKSDLHTAKEIKNSGIYVETDENADTIVNRTYEVISVFGHSPEEMEIELKQ